MSANLSKKQQAKSRKLPSRNAAVWSDKAVALIFGALLVAATLLVYARVAGFGFITMDDGLYVSQNNHVLAGLTADGIRWAFSATSTGNWHPLTWLSLMADSQIYSPGPAGYHVTNLILHIANSLLVFFLFRYLTGLAGRSAVVAALFALHPLHVESVAWISERKDVLSTLFWLLGIGAYLWYLKKPGAARYTAIAAAFAMALMAKPMAVSFPFTLLLFDIWPLRRISAAKVWEKAPLFVMAVVSCVVTLWAQGTASAVTALDQLPVHLRLANALLSYITYLEKLIWPAGLALFYPYRLDLLEPWRIAACLTAFSAITVYAIRAFRSHPYFTFGWLWYVITLLPVIGLVQVGSQALADRYTYVPSLGIFVLAVWGTSNALSGEPRWSWAAPWGTPTVACGVMLVLAVVAYGQTRFWRDDITAWEHAVAVTSPNYFSEYNLARAYVAQHRYDEALVHNRESIRLDRTRVEAYNNLAVLLMDRGGYDEAESALRSALRINPQFALALSNLGLLLGRTQRFDEAFRYHREALQLDPQNPEFRRNCASSHSDFGSALATAGRLDQAVAEFQSALSVDAEFWQADFNLALTYERLHRLDAAIDAYEKTIVANPACAEAHNDLGVLLAKMGKAGEASAHFQAALRIRPDYREAEDNLRLSSAAQSAPGIR